MDRKQVAKAVEALLIFNEQKAQKPSTLIDDERFVMVNIAYKRIPPVQHKPFRILLKHSLWGPEMGVCLITRDKLYEPLKKAVVDKSITGISKVLSLTKLKKNYSTFESKRQLCQLYDLFLADDSILPLLPRLLGKTFFLKRKQPSPVDLTKKDVQASLDKARNSTYLFVGQGSLSTLKIGRTTNTADQLIDNIMSAVDNAVGRTPLGWDNILTLSLKTNDSIALPIYNGVPYIDDVTAAAATRKQTAPKKRKVETGTEADEPAAKKVKAVPEPAVAHPTTKSTAKSASVKPSAKSGVANVTATTNPTASKLGTKAAEDSKPTAKAAATKAAEATKPAIKAAEVTKPTTKAAATKAAEVTKPTAKAAATKAAEATKPTAKVAATKAAEVTKPATKAAEVTKPATKAAEVTKPTAKAAATKAAEVTKPTTKAAEATKPTAKAAAASGKADIVASTKPLAKAVSQPAADKSAAVVPTASKKRSAEAEPAEPPMSPSRRSTRNK